MNQPTLRVRPAATEAETMPRLCMLTVPGFQVKSDCAAVRERLLDDFPKSQRCSRRP
jgi:hypothetical protein